LFVPLPDLYFPRSVFIPFLWLFFFSLCSRPLARLFLRIVSLRTTAITVGFAAPVVSDASGRIFFYSLTSLSVPASDSGLVGLSARSYPRLPIFLPTVDFGKPALRLDGEVPLVSLLLKLFLRTFGGSSRFFPRGIRLILSFLCERYRLWPIHQFSLLVVLRIPQ